MASTKLCVQCKGYRRLCGRHICPILERFKFAKLASLRVGYSYYGPTPPSLLVGEYGYPRIPIGVNVVGEKSDTPAIYDSPGEWWGKLDINEVIRLRSTLIYSRTIHNVRRPLRLLETIQESIMSLRPVDLEVQYKKPPRPSIRFDGHLAPMGPSAPLKKLELVSNPYVPRKVDQLIYDTDVKASIAVMELYRSGLSVYPIVRILSAGLLGLKFQRRLVPTRWAITTVDVMIGDSLVKRVKGYPEIRDVELYYVEYIGNRYVILMVPGPYIYEVVEIWLPRGLWTEGSTKPSIIHNWEDFRGPQPGGVNDGGYYAARLPILEALDKRGRRASVLVIREVTPEYYAPVGSWQIRESIRNALRIKPLKPITIKEAIDMTASMIKTDIGEVIKRSKVVAYNFFQEKLTDHLS